MLIMSNLTAKFEWRTKIPNMKIQWTFETTLIASLTNVNAALRVLVHDVTEVIFLDVGWMSRFVANLFALISLPFTGACCET